MKNKKEDLRVESDTTKELREILDGILKRLDRIERQLEPPRYPLSPQIPPLRIDDRWPEYYQPLWWCVATHKT